VANQAYRTASRLLRPPRNRAHRHASANPRSLQKKAALKHHPDRVPAGSPDRAGRTRQFQQINDAYYTLSDATRRRDYDEARRFHKFGSSSASSTAVDEDEDFENVPRPGESSSSYFNFPGGFGWPGGDQTPRDEAQFGNVFEEMLREEGMAEGEAARPTGKFWSIVGGLSGGALGFIVANFPGAVAGAVAGNRLGAVRDSKGKSVYEVFQELPQEDKAKMLSNLAAKVFAHALGGS